MTKSGFTLVEILVASAVFLLMVSGFGAVIVFNQGGVAASGERSRALLLAEEGIEATRNIRDSGFSNLIDGTHGLQLSGGVWTFSGSNDVTDVFTRTIEVGTVDADRKRVTSTVSWIQSSQRNGVVVLVTQMSNWGSSTGIPSAGCTSHCQGLSYSNGTCRENTVQCTQSGETYQSGGDSFCIGGPSADTCCCVP